MTHRISIEINEHRVMYQSPLEYLESHSECDKGKAFQLAALVEKGEPLVELTIRDEQDIVSGQVISCDMAEVWKLAGFEESALKGMKGVAKKAHTCNIYTNLHLMNAETITSYLEYQGRMMNDPTFMEDIGEKTLEEMERKNTLIELNVYPRTPISFFTVYHHDLTSAVSEALSE